MDNFAVDIALGFGASFFCLDFILAISSSRSAFKDGDYQLAATREIVAAVYAVCSILMLLGCLWWVGK